MRLAPLAFAAVLVVGTAQGAPEKAATRVQETETLLMVQVNGDSVDFRLVDPLGRVAVIAVDSATCAIPEGTVSKHSAIRDHDDSDFYLDDADTLEFGGGLFVLEGAQQGVWHLEALAARGCKDSCEVSILMWSMKHVNEYEQYSLRPGERVLWRVALGPRTEREGRQWARIERMPTPSRRR